MPNIMAFKTLDESGFLEFSVSNAKYLTFDTLDGNALKRPHLTITCLNIEAKKKNRPSNFHIFSFQSSNFQFC